MCLCVCVCVFLAVKLCLTLCNPMDCSPRGSFVHGIYPGKNIGVVVIASSRGSSPLRDRTCIFSSPVLAAISLPLSHLGRPMKKSSSSPTQESPDPHGMIASKNFQ